MYTDIGKAQKKRIREFFSVTAGEYKKKYFEQNLNFQVFNFLTRRKKILSMLAKEYYKNGCKFERCLDIGCGTGDYLVELLDFAEEVIGIDCAGGMISEAGKNIKGYQQRIKLFQDDIENLSFPDNHFDFIICAGVLEYLYDDTKAFQEIYRVLKYGGCAYITFPNKFSFFWQLDKLYSTLLHFSGDVLSVLNIFEVIIGRKRANVPHTIHRAFIPVEVKRKTKLLGFKYTTGIFSGYGSFYLCVKMPYYHFIANKLEYLNNIPLMRYCGLNYIIQVEKQAKL